VKLRRVPPDSIVIPEVRVTAKFDPEMWEQFQHSMKEVGAIAPIICIEVDDKLHLVDGLHRLVEAKNNGEKSVNVAVIPGDEVDVLTRNIFLDHLRGTPPVTDMITVIKELTDNYHLDSEAIAAKTGMTRDYVEKLQRLSQLTPAILAALDEGKIGVGQAAELCRLSDPVKQEAVFYQVVLYGWKTKELHDYVSSVLDVIQEVPEGKPEEVPREPVKIKCFYCEEMFDVTEIANPNTCRMCSLSFLTSMRQARAELAAEAEANKESRGG